MDERGEILDLGLRAGALLLAHGAETWRAEDTMVRLITGLGAPHVDAIATATSLFASISDGRDVQTRVRRVESGALNLEVVARVNDLSRRVAAGRLSRAALRAELEQLERVSPQYGAPVLVVGALLASIGFILLFGGGARETLVVLPGAAMLILLQQVLERGHLHPLATTALAALAGTIISALASQALPDSREDVVILSTVVLLVPGAAIVNAIGDLIGGHLLSGLARGASSALVASAIAAGVVLGLRLTGSGL